MANFLLLDFRAVEDDWEEDEKLENAEKETAVEEEDVVLAIPIFDFVETTLRKINENFNKNSLKNQGVGHLHTNLNILIEFLIFLESKCIWQLLVLWPHPFHFLFL